jgi:hypothetical protein
LARARYFRGGGRTAEGRAQRAVVRLQAAVLFGQGVSVSEIVRRLRVRQRVYV